MQLFTSKLKKRVAVAEGTASFYFEKPPDFQFQAGQFVDLTLIHPPETDAEGNIRSFTIASAPFEPDLMIATRLRDTAFKRVLKNMSAGSEIQVEGPSGSFTLHPDAARPAVFLTGGIGITPFLSILRQAARDQLAHRLFLFYSNRRPEDAAFLKELQEMEKTCPNYRLLATMTQAAKSRQPWPGEQGYINKETVMKFVPDLAAPIFYIAGPPEMVKGMKDMLKNAGIKASNIRSEDFAGY